MPKSMSDVISLVDFHAKSQLVGYESWEISKIEELYDIFIANDLEDFFRSIGRSASNIIHESIICFYSKPHYSNHLDIQMDFREYIREADKIHILESKPFLLPIEFEIFHMFLKTIEEDNHFVYEFNEETGEIRNTQELFSMYLYRNILDGIRKEYQDVFAGDLLG